MSQRDRDGTPPGSPGRRFVDGSTARRAVSATGTFEPHGDRRPARRSTAIAERAQQLTSNAFRSALQRLEQAPGGGTLTVARQALRASTYRGLIRQWKMQSRSEIVDEFGLDPVYAERWRPLFEFLYRSYWRVVASGMSNIPDRGRALLVSNHGGALPYDGAMLMYAVRYDHPAHRTARPLVEDVVFHLPFLGVALNRIGCVRACQQNAERLLANDQLLVVFPEGVKGSSKLYRQRYRLQRFGRGGFIKLALRMRTPIIPTAVVGAEEAHPLLARITWGAKPLGLPYLPITPTFPLLGPLGAMPLPGRWSIRFGEPIDLSPHYGAESDRDRILVNKMSERVRGRIQRMVDEALADRARA